MNKKRRAEIAAVIAAIEKAKQNIESDDAADLIDDAKLDANSIRIDEQDCLDNMPENLENSERYEMMEAAVENLEDAVDALDDALRGIEDEDPIDEIVSYLDDAVKSLDKASE